MNTKVKNKNAVVLITNPLDARFVYGKDIENTVKQMRESTHIRILGKLILYVWSMRDHSNLLRQI